MTGFTFHRQLLLATLALPLSVQLAAAQIELETIEVEGQEDNGTGPVEGYKADVTTSGSKTATPIMETPQAVTVIGAEQIEDQGARTIQEATRYAPGIRSGTFGADTRNDWFLMRGFSSQAGSYFLDDLQLFSSAFATWKMNPYLLERIDVLRGPSSALYGSSNPGGLINMISKRPTGQNRGEAGVGVDEHGNVWTGVDVEGVSEDGTWSWRVVGTGNAGGTEVDFTEDDRFAIQPTLTWTPTSDTKLELYASFQKFKTNGQNFLPYEGTVVAAPFGYIPRDLFTSEPSVDEFDRSQAMVGYRFEHSFNENVTVRQNLRYAHLDIDFRNVYGVGYAAPPTAASAQLARFSFLTTPVAGLFNLDNQLEWNVATGPVEHRFLFGLDYKRYDLDDAAAFAANPPLDLLNPVYGGVTSITPANYYNLNSTVQNQVGFYVQDQMTFAERWHLVLSGRYDVVETDVVARNTGVRTSQDSDAFSGRAGLIYNFDNGLAPYVSVSRSFLPLVGTDVGTGQPFQPETGIQYEAGLKFQPQSWGDSYLGVSVFDLTRENVVTNVAPIFSRQIGEVRSRGFELEAVGQITPALKLVGAYTWYDLEVTEGAPAEIGNVTPATPEQFGSLWLDYTVQGGAFEGVGFGGGVRYVGSSFADVANTLEVPEVFLVDAALRYEKENFSAALNVSNLFDEAYVEGCSSPTACFYGQGRRVSLTLGYKW